MDDLFSFGAWVHQRRRALDLKRCMAESVERLADWALLRGEPVPAATLLGAAEALRVTSGAPVPPLRQAAHEQIIVNLRRGMGVEAFNATWEVGQALRPAELRAYVLTLTEAGLVHSQAIEGFIQA